jgi:hypothetical protein
LRELASKPRPTVSEIEASIDAAAKAANLNPVLVWRQDEWPGSALIAALGSPRGDHPKTPGTVVYVLTKPLKIEGPDGDANELDTGEVLTPDEVEHCGGALARLVHSGHLAALPSDSGVIGAVNALLRRVHRLEAEVKSFPRGEASA